MVVSRLGDRYINASADALPQELKDLYGIEVQDNLNTRYMKYLFVSLKDPTMAALSSDMEDRWQLDKKIFTSTSRCL